ncbi:MAG TPA: leucine-rich repeat protein [Mobilitalea sp.]|nr:leucine-rich repeat protein [Mobilitalea sp.]
MNKIKIIAVVFIAVVLQITSVLPIKNIIAAEQPINAEDFVIKDGVLTKYVGEGGDVVVPEGVVAIGSAFQWCDSITSVTLPDTVTSIDGLAFSNCKMLKSITMSNSVTSIGDEAFGNCVNLVEISSLDGVLSIGSDAFGGTPWLKERVKENPMVVLNGILIFGRTLKGNIIIPDTVTSIAGNAFAFDKELTSITIPNSVTDIGVAAFGNCNHLVTVKMANSVKTLGSYAFEYCTRLKNVRLSNSIKLIVEGTFMDCTALTKITIPYSVSKIERTAFVHCKNLKYVAISNKVTSVEQYGIGAFDTCPNRIFYGLENSYIQSYAKDKNIPFKKLAIAVTKKTLAVGDKYNLKMNSLAVCTWKSSDKSIATVDSYGNVTAKKKGKVIITATLYGKSYQCVVTIL